jgi:predicted TIM-barrel fold metal-dependent hydrolase
MIIDVHAHCGRWYFPSDSWEAVQVSRLCDRYGIHRIVFSSSLSILYDMTEGNHQTSKFIEQDERFYGYLYLNPADPRGSESELKKYEGNPLFVGIKMHPSYSGENPDSPATIELMKMLPGGTNVLIHTWGPEGVRQVCSLASQCPDLNVIMGHMGGTHEEGWRAGIEGARTIPNTYLEICGSHLERDRIAEAVGTIGADRILHGSDLTLISPAWSIGQVMGAEIPEGDKRRILYGNAAKLFDFT